MEREGGHERENVGDDRDASKSKNTNKSHYKSLDILIDTWGKAWFVENCWYKKQLCDESRCIEEEEYKGAGWVAVWKDSKSAL